MTLWKYIVRMCVLECMCTYKFCLQSKLGSTLLSKKKKLGSTLDFHVNKDIELRKWYRDDNFFFASEARQGWVILFSPTSPSL